MLWDLARGRTPRTDDGTLARVVERAHRAAVGVVFGATVGLLLLVGSLVTLRGTGSDRAGVRLGVLLLVLTLVLELLRRRALATARRLGHDPARSPR